MFFNVLNVGKDIANKIGNKFLNLSEIEIKIKEATNDEPWGPQSSIMKEISYETFSSLNFNEVMTFLWFRMFTERPPNKRRTYKGLVLLSYIIINGSDFVAIRCKDHLVDIQRLEIFTDSNGIPDSAIRKKATEICDLINDSQRLKAEREKANRNSMKYFGQQSVANVDSDYRGRTQSIETNLGEFDNWHPRSKSIPSVIGESFFSFVNTFTQNISGPPPTETHDNFDLPSDYEIDQQLNTKKDTKLSIDKNEFCSNNNQQIANKIEVKQITEPVKNVDNEAPIIDFSEPAPTTDVFNTDFEAEFRQHTNRAQDDDFGDFSVWDNQVNKESVKPICYSQTSDFYSLGHNVTAMSNVDKGGAPKLDDKISENKSKTDSKLGNTWNDMGSLKIDLDNVCGVRRPMFSKS